MDRFTHKRKSIPIFRYLQPAFGYKIRLRFISMSAKSRKNINLPARRLLADNAEQLRDQRFSSVGDKNSALAKAAGHSLSTIQRVVDPGKSDTGVSIDILANVAAALSVLPCQLLLPRGMTLITESSSTRPSDRPTGSLNTNDKPDDDSRMPDF